MTELTKVYFIHDFNTVENQTYVGPNRDVNFSLLTKWFQMKQKIYIVWHSNLEESHYFFTFKTRY